mmetsp:Transcript_3158/g.3573  ORF Transcript_3158/g.3573 Transcript_3158/m.3573 type:complete len:153 (-) Transcript_3158:167-625(-)
MERPVMYLDQKDWSPRYEDTFYTIRLDRFELFTLLPDISIGGDDDTIEGKTNLPAYYYKIQIYCGRRERSVYRRYSQFKWLNENLPKNIPNDTEQLTFPPRSPCLCYSQNEEFAKNRLEQLREFLRDILTRRGVASHDAVAKFLELDFVASK